MTSKTVPRAHPPYCGNCYHETECPRIGIYNQYKNEAVKLCSKKCYEAYLGFMQNLKYASQIEQDIRAARFRPIPETEFEYEEEELDG